MTYDPNKTQNINIVKKKMKEGPHNQNTSSRTRMKNLESKDLQTIT
jgi:hypothetical protein